uniref:Beta-1,3-glucosyltransferase n=1 Tax=Davidia involucrata TaxID=16924 RepID=A0A5B7BSP7_DAVIN
MKTAKMTTISYRRHEQDNHLGRSPGRGGTRRWRQSHTGTAVVAVVALLISTTAWLSLVFSGTTARCWHRFKDWERSPKSFPWRKRLSNSSSDHGSSSFFSPPPPFLSSPLHQNSTPRRRRGQQQGEEEELSLKHIVFGIAGSSQLWKRRKEFVRQWWRPDDMRGHVWLEEQVLPEDGDDTLPPIMVSEDISRFRYTNPTGHPSGLRISRIVGECFRLGLPHVRWFVLGDDDTIFNAHNLVAVLNKYDPSEMVYIGSPSESHSANTYFSHSMAFGGGGIAISHPLAEALTKIPLDECLERYPKLYGSDDRLHACITELGIPLTREHGFHQCDIRGNAHGLLSSHPIAPFVSIHHVEAVDPFYPGLTTLESLKLFTRAMRVEPSSFLQRSICYDRARHLTFSVSLGYAVQVFPYIVLPRELERSEQTYSAWNRISHRNEFDFDTRDPYRSVCKKPTLFFLKDLGKENNVTLGFYRRARGNDELRRKVFCFPRLPPLQHVQHIQVLGHPLSKNWHLVPRRLCCKLNQMSDELLRLTVGQCEKGAFGSIA